MADEPNPNSNPNPVQTAAPNRGQPQAPQVPQAPQAARRDERQPNQQQQADVRGRDAAARRREEHEKAREERANRPQQVGEAGQRPTPTQQENDEIRNGLRHIDDKEDDGSGPDIQFGMRRVDAGSKDGGYETR